MASRARRRATDVRKSILSATERLLVDRRFDVLSVAEIIHAAGVSRASFYFYFESKHAVLAELVRDAVGEAHEVAEPWLEHQADASARATLHQGTLDGARLWRKHGPVLRAIVENWRSDPGLEALWTEMMERFATSATERIARDRAAGRAPAKDVDPRMLAEVLTWMSERAYYLAAAGHPAFADEERVVDALTEAWYAAIYAR
jgi:TetR/AcrR family transcriptional regulator, ethionamide resistance regulator